MSDESEPATKACPYCAEEIRAEARKCKHCGEFLDDAAPTALDDLVREHLEPRTAELLEVALDKVRHRPAVRLLSGAVSDGTAGLLVLHADGLEFLDLLGETKSYAQRSQLDWCGLHQGGLRVRLVDGREALFGGLGDRRRTGQFADEVNKFASRSGSGAHGRDGVSSAKRRWAQTLLVLALVALAVGGLMWSSANADADRSNSYNQVGAAISDTPYYRTVEPDHTAATVAFVVAGVMFIGSLIMFSGVHGGSEADRSPQR